jgi:hypothetical protein
MRPDRAGDPAQAADLVGLVGGDLRQGIPVRSSASGPAWQPRSVPQW